MVWDVFILGFISDTNIAWQEDLGRGLVPRYPSALSLKLCLSNVFYIPSSQLSLLQSPGLGKQYFLNVIQSPCGAICRAFTCHYCSMAAWRAAAVRSWNVGNHFFELWCHSQASVFQAFPLLPVLFAHVASVCPPKKCNRETTSEKKKKVHQRVNVDQQKIVIQNSKSEEDSQLCLSQPQYQICNADPDLTAVQKEILHLLS